MDRKPRNNTDEDLEWMCVEAEYHSLCTGGTKQRMSAKAKHAESRDSYSNLFTHPIKAILSRYPCLNKDYFTGNLISKKELIQHVHASVET